ncbi:MAG: glucokinase [Woeseia sp.]
MAAGSLLIGDIGGTNARFALARDDAAGFDKALTLSCADFATAEIAIADYLKRTGAAEPRVICIAAAGPVVDNRVRFTNNHWTLSCRDLAEDFKTERVRLLNDFEAIAYSIPCFGADDCVPAGLLPVSNLRDRDFTVGIVGPGTGLGAAGLLCRDGALIPIVGEGGHVGFAPESQLQMQLLSTLRDQFDRVSDERLVSGPGLENIYEALVGLHGEKPIFATAKEIFTRAAANEDVRANEALQLFYEILGQVAGNLALTLGAADGVYIAGGIVKRDPSLLANSRFRSAFESKGRHRSLMERIPTQVIVHPEPGLLGASYVALKMLD